MPYEQTPIDPISADRLAATGLELRLVDAGDGHEVDQWVRAEHRGFHLAQPKAELLAEIRQHVPPRRTVGVYDATSPASDYPVATLQSWLSPLTVPGGAAIDQWSISSVTVAPTHRRRGIARALLEGELRAAAAHGAPIAGLTVTETTIYGRYGFGVATFDDSVDIETGRVRWAAPGPDAAGRLHLIEAEALWPDALRIVDEARTGQPGGLGYSDSDIGRAVGALGDDRAALRAVRYDDRDGRPAGFATYQLGPAESDFAKHTLTVHNLVATNDEARTALWRFLLEIDLVSTVRAPGRPVDDPVTWQLGDLRASSRRRGDGLWLRILDLPAVFAARRYAAAATVVLDVEDPYGFAAGRFLLTTKADGTGRAQPIDGEGPASAASLALSIADLSSVYLGGVSPVALARTGRIDERTPGAAFTLERSLATDRAPWLMFGF